MIPSFTKLLHYIDRDAAGLTELEKPATKDAQRYVINSLMEEAIASSQLEGAATTRKDAKRMLRTNSKPKTIDERMILNNYLAMQNIKAKRYEKLTPELILEMHRIIVKDTLKDGGEWGGRFREDNETVVGDPEREEVIFHRPPDCDKISSMISELCDFANGEDARYIHPIIKATILHFMIGYIHPFIDGNGRLARSLFYWFALKNGYWLFEYTSISLIIKKSQTKYGLAYQYSETDDNDLTYFIKFHLECINKAVVELAEYISRKEKEQRAACRIVESHPELNATEVLIMKDLIKSRSIVSIGEIKTKYHIAYQTARLYVMHLESLGYLLKAGRDRKKVLYRIDADRVCDMEGQMRLS
jgi:Fic family protein